MRLYLLLIGLIPVLALGADFYLNHRSQAWEASLGNTARQIVAETLGGTSKPLVSTPRRIAESAPNVWTLDGTVTRTSAGQSANETYRIELEQICGEVEDLACWLPRQIVVGGRTLEPRVVAGTGRGATAQATDSASLSLETTAAAPAEAGPEPARAQPDSRTLLDITPLDDAAQTATAAATRSDPSANRTTAPGGLAATITPGAGGTTLQPDAGQQSTSSAQLAAVDMTVQESLIWLIQDRLNQLGYRETDTPTPNGTLGPGTIFAIKAYQANYGMLSDGLPSFELLDHLDRNLAQHRDGGAPIELAPQAQAMAQAPARTASEAETLEDAAGDRSSLALQKLERAVMPAAGGAVPGSDVAQVEAAQVEPAQSASRPVAMQQAVPQHAAPAQAAPQQAGVQQVAAVQTAAPEILGSDQPATPPLTAGRTIRDEPAFDESLVFLIQDRLNRLGYDQPRPISLDGKLGPRTRAAIVDYQSRHGLESDGRPTRELLDHLEAQLTGRRVQTTGGPGGQAQ